MWPCTRQGLLLSSLNERELSVTPQVCVFVEQHRRVADILADFVIVSNDLEPRNEWRDQEDSWSPVAVTPAHWHGGHGHVVTALTALQSDEQTPESRSGVGKHEADSHSGGFGHIPCGFSTSPYSSPRCQRPLCPVRSLCHKWLSCGRISTGAAEWA